MNKKTHEIVEGSDYIAKHVNSYTPVNMYHEVNGITVNIFGKNVLKTVDLPKKLAIGAVMINPCNINFLKKEYTTEEILLKLVNKDKYVLDWIANRTDIDIIPKIANKVEIKCIPTEYITPKLLLERVIKGENLYWFERYIPVLEETTPTQILSMERYLKRDITKNLDKNLHSFYSARVKYSYERFKRKISKPRSQTTLKYF